jgi:hypothetical protein
LKYNEWLKKLEELHEKTKTMLVDEEVLCEAVTITQHEYKVFLGDQIIFKVDGKTESIYDFKRAHSTREKGWDRLLGGLTTKVEMAQELNIKLINALVTPFLKEAVLDRLTGAADIPDNEQIIRTAVDRRIEKLEKLVSVKDVFRSGRNLEFPLPSPSENYDLQINIIVGYRGSLASVVYGNKNGLKCCWSFLQNFDKIEETIKRFAVVFAPLVELCDEANKEWR